MVFHVNDVKTWPRLFINAVAFATRHLTPMINSLNATNPEIFKLIAQTSCKGGRYPVELPYISAFHESLMLFIFIGLGHQRREKSISDVIFPCDCFILDNYQHRVCKVSEFNINRYQNNRNVAYQGVSFVITLK